MRPSLGERNVPDRWDSRFRAGTYRLTVLLPSSSLALGIRYSTVSTAFELEADGLVVARVSNHEYRVGCMWRAFALGDFAASLVVLALFAFLFVRAQEALS